MKKILLCAIAMVLPMSILAQGRLIDDVNVFVGTDGFGNVYPGAQLPFGGIQISPDCDDKDYDCAAGYKYAKPSIQGFSLRTFRERTTSGEESEATGTATSHVTTSPISTTTSVSHGTARNGSGTSWTISTATSQVR